MLPSPLAPWSDRGGGEGAWFLVRRDPRALPDLCSRPWQTSKAHRDGSHLKWWGQSQTSPRAAGFPPARKRRAQPCPWSPVWDPCVSQIKGCKPNSQPSWLKQGLLCVLTVPAADTAFNPATECHPTTQNALMIPLFPILCPSLSTVPHN